MDVWECALGFMNTQMLLTAEEMGLFRALDDGPRTSGELAARLELPEDSVNRLLTGLCALGFIERRDNRFANAPEAAEKLVPGKPGYVGSMFRHLREDLYPLWGHLGAALREGKAQWAQEDGAPAPTERFYSDPKALRAFMEGMHAITYSATADFAAAAPELAEVREIVDVGGASGAFLIRLAEHFPKLRGTVYDLPPVRPVTEDMIRRAGLADRLRFQGGDFWEDPIPGGADAYALGFILHDWDAEGGEIILRKIADAARPGALLIIGEYLLDDDRTGPLFVARMDLNMLVAARGRERTAPEYADWIGRFGFRLKRIQPGGYGKNFLLARFDPP